MTTDPKAPLPDEVENALARLESYSNGLGDGCCSTIRAHIAALSKTIKCQQVDLAGLRKLDFRVTELKEQINLMTKHQAGADDKLTKLEAENKRLVEALDKLARLGGPHGGYGNSIGNQIAQAAIALETNGSSPL